MRQTGTPLPRSLAWWNVKEIFTFDAHNDYASPILSDSRDLSQLSSRLNFQSLFLGWEPLHFVFEHIGRKKQKIPAISTIYMPGYLALKKDLVSVVFPVLDPVNELLPIFVDEQEWVLLNCLRTATSFDPQRSDVLRDVGERAQIFYVNHLLLTDLSVLEHELFTLDGSNRAGLYCLPSFKERVESLGFDEILFEPIGSFA
jgi:hypothetical protein